MIRPLFILILVLTVVSASAQARVVAELYSARVPVSDRSEAARLSAIRQGLARVLVKLTGSRQALSDPGLTAALGNAADYLRQYSYTSSENIGSESGTTAPLFLEARFSPAPIETLLRELFLPVWPADRPVVLLWLVTGDAAGPRFVEEDEAPAVLAREALELRGVPYQMPLYDLTDAMALNPSQVWAQDQVSLKMASRRYGVDHWLVLQFDVGHGPVSGRWALAGQRQAADDLQQDDLEQWISAAVDAAVDELARPMTFRAGQLGESLRLVVDNVNNYADLSGLLALLSTLEIVTSTQILEVDRDRLLLEVTVEGKAERLADVLAGQPRLTRVVSVGGEQSTGIAYRWHGGSGD